MSPPATRKPDRRHRVRHSPRDLTSNSYRSMLRRCHASNSDNYERYGARGIVVCERWRQSIENFIADMGLRPSKAYTLDRIDGTRGYEPSNCRWATIEQQSANRKKRPRECTPVVAEARCLPEVA